MTIAPIIPIPVMAVICLILLILKRRGIFNFIRQIFIVILLFVINLRIMLPDDSLLVIHKDVDVLFVIDNTVSMLAEDCKGRRIDAVKEDVGSIVEAFDSARFALISLGNTANYLVPYTYESDLILQAVGAFEGHSKFIAEGTSLNKAYDVMEETLSSVKKYDDETRIQIVFFISDGEITDGSKLESFEDLDEYIDGGAVLGYGTKEGGKMHVRILASDDTSYEYLTYFDKDFSEVVAKSKIDEKNLKALASDMGIDYYHMINHKMINEITEEIQTAIDEGLYDSSIEEQDCYKETYWMFAIGLACLLFWDFVYYRIKQNKEK